MGETLNYKLKIKKLLVSMHGTCLFFLLCFAPINDKFHYSVTLKLSMGECNTIRNAYTLYRHLE